MPTPHRNTPERATDLAARAEAQRSRVEGFTASPRKRIRLSTRGQKTQSWRTKAWTPQRRNQFIADRGVRP